MIGQIDKIIDEVFDSFHKMGAKQYIRYSQAEVESLTQQIKEGIKQLEEGKVVDGPEAIRGVREKLKKRE